MKKQLIPILVLGAALGAGGIFMFQNGNDAVSAAAVEKAAILSADTVNASFLQVGGKVVEILVTEELQVKKGDVLMRLDPTDIDFQISKLEADAGQFDVKIKQAEDSIQTAADKADMQIEQAQIAYETAKIAEQQVTKGARQEDIERQKLVVEAAREARDTAERNYNRTRSMYDNGEVPQTSVDTAEAQYTAAQNSLGQQEVALQKLMAGPTAEERNQAHLSTEKAKLALRQAEQVKQEVAQSESNVELLHKQKETLLIQLEQLRMQKERLVLQAPVDGKVIRVIPKIGENVSANSPVVLIETDQLYYDIYVDETQVTKFEVGQKIPSHLVGLDVEYEGTVRYVTAAPQYAGYRMSRDKGQSDLSTFQIRIDLPRDEKLLPGMTVEVNADVISQK